MEKYKNIFDILDALEEAREAINEAKDFRRELSFMGEPSDPQLKEIYRNTVRTIRYNIKSNELIVARLEKLYTDWRENNE